jgi:TetR/AcrR family transcriptional repressor of mexJK operon
LVLSVALLADHDPSDCRSRLIQAATEVFIEEGYRASIERVAVRANVARQTLYNHFPSKADLFGEVIKQATAALLVTLDGKAEGLRERLLRFGIAFRAKALSSEGLGFYRALVAESKRFPELAATFYRTGPARTAARLRGVLQDAMDRGELRTENSELATTILLSMLVGAERGHFLLSGEPPPDPDPARVAQLVDCYLRAFASEISSSNPAPQRSVP